MKKIRMKFEKSGKAVYISHLDLMRCLSRAFVRAGVSIHHTQGYNPRPHMVFANSLSLGYTGLGELLDIEVPEDADLEALRQALNGQLPRGLCFSEVYEGGRPLKEIAFACYRLAFEQEMTEAMLETLRSFAARDSILVQKRSKKGMKEADIAPLIHSLTVTAEGAEAVLSCADAMTLNPELLMRTVSLENGMDLDKIRTTRVGFLDGSGADFR